MIQKRENLKLERLATAIDKYVSACLATSIPKKVVRNLEERLSHQGIQLTLSGEFPNSRYQLTLPISLDALNSHLEPEDQMNIGEELYFPPVPILDYVDSRHLNAECIGVEEKNETTIFSCENYGHALGFLQFYARLLREM